MFDVVWAIPRVDREKVILLSSQGMSRNAIAKYFGCAGMTISRVLKSVES
ncbi:MAG: helix-turn-helix domain-containing protein [Halobacteriovoraceae bacterium]|nr:helix-turn-helix domain-containing protein [Halobacteriovoraceae bacterium]MBT5093054.1 helix-turn-helix domain-containing protein [Halobacteriovoraceae bacterium]